MPEAVGSFAFIEGEDRLLIAFATGLAYYDIHTQVLNWLHAGLCDGINDRLNDGRVDRQGRFWVGSMSKLSNEYSEATGRGRLYCLNNSEELHQRESNIHISNGTCWSPDGTTMYFADSPRGEIYQYDFDLQSGENLNRQLFQTTNKGIAPDGACVDSQGYMWSAQWGSSKVVRYSPAGDIVAEIDLPVSQPSCVAFGGNDLDHLLITTARVDLSESQLQLQPQAGNVFIYKTNLKGLPENKYKRSN